MFSVLRFVPRTENELWKQTTWNTLRSSGLSISSFKRKHISCDLSTSSSWTNHESDIRDFLARYSSLLESCRDAAVEIQIDIAIEPEDFREGGLEIPLSSQTVDLLSQYGASVGFSFYLQKGGQERSA